MTCSSGLNTALLKSERERDYLVRELADQAGFGELVGRGASMRRVAQQIAMAASTSAPVLISGEAGTGRELVAREIHRRSARHSSLLVKVRCNTLPAESLEATLFGVPDSRGDDRPSPLPQAGFTLFELAEGGTLFLEHVDRLSPGLQARLLGVLNEDKPGPETPVAPDPVSACARIVASTRANLAAEAKAGRFSMELYCKLSVFPIELAPLRERSEDVADLANHFLRRIARELGLDGLELGSDQLAALRRHSWPGNVREIRTVLERVVIRACNGPLEFPKRLGASTPTSTDQGQAPEARELTLGRLRELERELVWRALEKCDGRIYGPSGAAAALGLKPTTLASKMKRYGFLRSQREVSWSLTASID